jgi:hypothetical protein
MAKSKMFDRGGIGVSDAAISPDWGYSELEFRPKMNDSEQLYQCQAARSPVSEYSPIRVGAGPPVNLSA